MAPRTPDPSRPPRPSATHGLDGLAGMDDDLAGMEVAITVAWTARHRVSPRPWVGAVVVPAGASVAGGPVFTGATDGRRGSHAEVEALAAAGEAARGATLYCTLEPCAHHGVTPPCAEAVADAGVARVVVALEDPDPRVAGAGLSLLRERGVHVTLGTGAEVVATQLAPYLVHRRTGRPLVVLKLAATLDGRVAMPDGSSQWITGPAARGDAHRLRADSDAVLVGAGTVRADDPSLTVRLAGWEGVSDTLSDHGGDDRRQPLRVVLGEPPADASIHPALVWTGEPADLLDELGRRGVLQLLVEGGPRVAASLHHAGLIDRYVVYLAPALTGGDQAPGLFAGAGVPTIADLWRGEVTAVTLLGPDVRIDLEPPTGWRAGSESGTLA
jgi:diaminohydroxyphosphoribosylaminopyrimidine deaminase / 5-amino-6-(5-phosphoribosylamino)uracil reductase